MSTMELQPHTPGAPWDEAHIELGLTTLALHGGSASRAARQLKVMGTEIPKATLELWRDEHSKKYAEIRDHQAPEIQRLIASQWEDSARESARVHMEYLEASEKALPDIPPRDLPAAYRNMVTGTAIATDKLMLARERPLPQTPAQRTLEQLTNALVGMGVARLVTGAGPDVIEATCHE